MFTGRIVLGLAIAGGAVGFVSLGLYFGLGVISLKTSVELTLVSLTASAAAVIIGLVLRRRARTRASSCAFPELRHVDTGESLLSYADALSAGSG